MPRRGTFLDGPADAGDTPTMAFNPREIPLLSPTTVAIHDDGDVAWPAFARRGRQAVRIFQGLRGHTTQHMVTIYLAHQIDYFKRSQSIANKASASFFAASICS